MRCLDRSCDILTVPFAPHDLLFPYALAVVHQGGIGTLAETLCAGKPMLIMPYGHDQADNAWRAGRLGVARTLPRRRYRRETVARELDRLLEVARGSGASARVRGEMTRERGAENAASLIESALVNGSNRTDSRGGEVYVHSSGSASASMAVIDRH
jgi:UDP:flavonoid glycosyltransferase YjiC (YdhE family)